MISGASHTRRQGFLATTVPWLLAWLALAALISVLVARSAVASGFAGNARETSGAVVAIEPTNHATVRATYEVDGANYVVADSFIGPPNPEFLDVRVGDRVTVFYDPGAPANAVLSEPRKRSASELAFGVLAAVILPTGFVGAVLLSVMVRRFLVGLGRTG